jgi:hypothetical protein
MVSSATCVRCYSILIRPITSYLVFIIIGIWPLTEANVCSNCVFFVSGKGEGGGWHFLHTTGGLAADHQSMSSFMRICVGGKLFQLCGPEVLEHLYIILDGVSY